MPNFLWIPKVQLSYLLFLIYLSTLVRYPTLQNLYLLFLCAGLCILFDLIFAYLRKKQFFIPLAAIATGLIIALTVDPNANWYQLATICAFAIGSKNFLRISQKHIFNPAGFGLLAGGVLLSLPVSWWAVSFQNISQLSLQNLLLFLILLSPALVSAYRMRRYLTILSFLISYMLIGLAVKSNVSIFDPTVIFFSMVMLPEPMTSPVNYQRQLLYGVFIALLFFIFSFTFLANILPDPLIPALLLGNLVFFKFR